MMETKETKNGCKTYSRKKEWFLSLIHIFVAAIMKLRQYGLAKKPMIVVPNHLIGQWSGEFRQLYANAKLLDVYKRQIV